MAFSLKEPYSNAYFDRCLWRMSQFSHISNRVPHYTHALQLTATCYSVLSHTKIRLITQAFHWYKHRCDSSQGKHGQFRSNEHDLNTFQSLFPNLPAHACTGSIPQTMGLMESARWFLAWLPLNCPQYVVCCTWANARFTAKVFHMFDCPGGVFV